MADENQKSIININNTSYNIQNDWFDVTRKYFDIDSDDEQALSFLKTSLFGYNTEIFANEIKNNVFHRNIIYDEHFLNTASFPESIYNFAKTFNYTVDMATPSYVRVNVAIAKTDLVNNKFATEVKSELGNVVSTRKTFELTLSNDFDFIMNNMIFRLPYPVKITFKETEDRDDYSLIATYDIGEEKFPNFKPSNEYIKLWQDYINGEKIIFMGLDLFQVSKITKEIDIISEDITDNLFYNFKYENQLAFFNVWYEYNGNRTLLKTYFNNTYEPKTDEKFCYFSFIDDDQIQISFGATSSAFRPSLNSRLIVDMYCTKGEAGNFSYIGNQFTVNFSNNGQIDKVPLSIIPITECSGGLNKPSYTTVKNGIINNFAVRDNLIIDNDLDIFFNYVNSTESVNGSSIEFIKKRNDVIKRLFNAYLIIRDNNRKVIPTNTAPSVEVSEKYLDRNNWCIQENTDILYDVENKKYLVDEGEITDYSKYLRYKHPFLLKVQQDPILIGNYYSTYVNDTLDIKLNYTNPHISDYFYMKDIYLTKNNIDSNKYLLTISMNTTYISNDEFDLKLRCLLYDEGDKPLGFFDLKCMVDGNFLYDGYLETDNTIEDNRIALINSLYNPRGSAVDRDMLETVSVADAVRMEIAVLVKSNDSNDKHGNFKHMGDLDEYTTAVIFETNDDLKLFKNLQHYMESDVRTPKEENKTGIFTLKQVPLVEAEYFVNSYKKFYDVWLVYLDIIKDNIDKLENNTLVDIKFTNTYGPSQYFYYNTEFDTRTGEVIYNYIDNVHLDIKLVIHTNYYIDDEIDLSIRQYISDFLELCNNDRLFPISNLIRSLENEYDIIKFIEFFEIGDHDTQKIRSTFTSLLDMTKQQVEDYVPEYLNIEKKLDLALKTDDEDNNKLIEYPYNFNIDITYK